MGARGEALNRWEACVACDSALGEALILPLSPAPHLGRTPSLRTGRAHRPHSASWESHGIVHPIPVPTRSSTAPETTSEQPHLRASYGKSGRDQGSPPSAPLAFGAR